MWAGGTSFEQIASTRCTKCRKGGAPFLHKKVELTTLLVGLHASHKRCMSQSAECNGRRCCSRSHGTGKRKAFILRWGARQRLIEKALRQLSTFIVKISFLLSFVSKFTNLLIGHTSGIYSRNIIIIISPSYFFKRTFGGAI